MGRGREKGRVGAAARAHNKAQALGPGVRLAAVLHRPGGPGLRPRKGTRERGVGPSPATPQGRSAEKRRARRGGSGEGGDRRGGEASLPPTTHPASHSPLDPALSPPLPPPPWQPARRRLGEAAAYQAETGEAGGARAETPPLGVRRCGYWRRAGASLLASVSGSAGRAPAGGGGWRGCCL